MEKIYVDDAGYRKYFVDAETIFPLDCEHMIHKGKAIVLGTEWQIWLQKFKDENGGNNA